SVECATRTSCQSRLQHYILWFLSSSSRGCHPRKRAGRGQGRREMQIAQQGTTGTGGIGISVPDSSPAARPAYADYKIIRRNGAVVGFEPAKISVAMTKAYL